MNHYRCPRCGCSWSCTDECYREQERAARRAVDAALAELAHAPAIVRVAPAVIDWESVEELTK